jgi:tetratricopeptide (TPR) repeat protein
MQAGLKAEDEEKFTEAERLYTAAKNADPADPVPLRYLGELYRHQIGDWNKATEVFNQILAMKSDPLSQAVALHGIGKMTIHNGQFKKGEQLMEKSLAVYPLAMTCRNLAVYFNSEGDRVKATEYTKEAMKLDPQDRFNLVFGAALFAGNGHPEEALKIAKENEDLLPASYNLAAIYAQNGQKEKALELLKRHFYQYERYKNVRSKEMMEARVDAVFASIVHDPAFLALTSDADNKLPMQGMSQDKPATTR